MIRRLACLSLPTLLASALMLSSCGGRHADVDDIERPSYVLPRGEARDVKIMAWNLEHFVDPYDDPYIKNEREDGPQMKSTETLQALAVAIKQINPDVMVLSEVESDRAVKLFLDGFLPDHDYKYFAGVEAMEWYQNVVIVSRFPIGRIVSLREREITSAAQNRTRKDINNRLLGAEILGPGTNRFFVLGLHLKAGRPAEDVEWRTLQAGIIQELLAHEEAALPGLPILVTGDLNQYPDSSEFVALTDAGPVDLESPFAEWGFPPTHPADGPKNHIDHILHNDAMKAFYVPESAAVATPYDPATMKNISDHLPVVATYRMPQ